MKIHGATPHDWVQFDLHCGLTADLLPVVSNLNAPISPTSTMKKLGKTPSCYNSRGLAIGFKSWTRHDATPAEIDKWAKVPDYGICIQTRRLVAFDIDVADLNRSLAIRATIERLWGKLPCRFRPNSGKMLCIAYLAGPYGKRRFKTDGGIMELLARGQQFIAVGMHEDGAPYEWEGGLPEFIPTLDADNFEGKWAELVAEHSLDGKCEISGQKVRHSAVEAPNEFLGDATLEYLEKHGYVISYGNEGVNITCPFEEEHTTGASESGTTYFIAGTLGYAQGHFKCLHAHCAHRADVDFLDKIGMRMAEFEVLPALVDERKPRPPFKTGGKGGEIIIADVNNLRMGLERPDYCGYQIRFDNFRDEVIIMRDGDNNTWRPMTDEDYYAMRLALAAKQFAAIPKELMRDAVRFVASRNECDTAKDWLNSQEWDGVPRVADFYAKYFNTDATPYAQAVSLYSWTALAGRILVPGIKADMVPVLVGPQGIGKSAGIAAMSPHSDFFETIDLTERDDNQARKMRGKLVIEVGEMRGLHKREHESVKEFITRQFESWVPKFVEFARRYARRSLMFGTSNPVEFLSDPTGNRRWLPLTVNSQVEVPGIAKDMQQLWAEGAVLFKSGGIQWRDAERLALEVHDKHKMGDTWADMISAWLNRVDSLEGKCPAEREYITVMEIARDVFMLEPRTTRSGEDKKIAEVLRNLGYEPKNKWVGETRQRVWVKIM